MQIEHRILNTELKITVSGDFVCAYSSDFHNVLSKIRADKIRRVVVSCRGIRVWDNSLVVFLSRIKTQCCRAGVAVAFTSMPPGCERMMKMVHECPVVRHATPDAHLSVIEKLGDGGIRFARAWNRASAFVGRVGTSVARFARGAAQMRRVDLMAALESVGPRAVLIVSLISFLIGLILAFVGAAQLKLFGAQIYVASLVAIASIRIMGAMMTGIIMAGRTGASYAATIGTMQTNEELDALDVMGINKIDFLVLPRVVALTLTMPILTLLADVMAILGGAFIGIVMLGIPGGEYFKYTFDAIGIQNFSVGIFHGLVYGVIIALCGCYYGINCGRNANSVGVATTRAVVSSIVWMVVATGIITFVFEVLGI